jgi:predicted DNA-binding protein (MmcQ/YjbR family)
MLYDPDQMRARVKAIVESFPEASTELVLGLHLKLTVRGKNFGWFMEDHHGDGRLAINCKAVPGVSQTLVEKDENVYHIPKYVGNKGWVGIWLDVPGVDWDEVQTLLYEAYELVAPKSLLKLGKGS